MKPVRSEIETDAVLAPHGGQPIVRSGTPLDSARAVAILLHGRGADARDILSLADAFAVDGVHYLAPQAAGNSWYPASFLTPVAANQPGIDSVHAVIERILEALGERGFGPERCALIGFSQGACVATDHAARFPRRYGLIAAFTGGVIGPPDAPFEFDGSLQGTPIFLGSSDPDPHVPWTRVRQTAEILEAMGAKVDLARYPGQPHAVNQDEVDAARRMLRSLTEPGT